MFHLSVPTLRYYDQEGMIPGLEKDASGHRVFNLQNVDAVQVIECLKGVQMPLKDIKQFMEWNREGDSTLQERLDLFNQLDEEVSAQIDHLEQIQKMIHYKQWYYQQAVNDGTEKYVAEHKTPINEVMAH